MLSDEKKNVIALIHWSDAFLAWGRGLEPEVGNRAFFFICEIECEIYHELLGEGFSWGNLQTSAK